MFQVRDGPSQTYMEIQQRGQAQNPMQEQQHPNIDWGLRNPQVILLPAPDMEEDDDEEQSSTQVVYLMRETNPEFCYIKIEGKVPRRLGWGWGVLETAVMCRRVIQETDPIMRIDENDMYTFQMPSRENAEYVAIKTLRRSAVDDGIQRGYRENPYIEILRMQQLGDNQHVLQCIEALEDNDYLYIVTPYCREGDLWDNIPWVFDNENSNISYDDMDPNNAPAPPTPGYPEETAKQLFGQILRILQYLERNGICHHDISPGNFMFFNGQLLLADFAMSLQFPRDQYNQRFLTTPPSVPFGTKQYQAPDAYICHPYDGVFTDLWSAAVLLYNLLTGHILYRMPLPTCLLFRYYLLARALSRNPNAQLLRQFEDDPNLPEMQAPLQLLSQDALELLENLLHVAPAQRWNLHQAMNSPWIVAARR